MSVFSVFPATALPACAATPTFMWNQALGLMKGSHPEAITALLQAAKDGDAQALQQVFVPVYDELRRLEAVDPRQTKIIAYRFFAGLTIQETAEALGISAPAATREWRLGRAWLCRELGG